MSKENVIKFEEMILNTPALQEEVQALGDSLEAIVALGRQNNYDFSLDELKASLVERQAGVQLDDAELEQVAGSDGAQSTRYCTYGCYSPIGR